MSINKNIKAKKSLLYTYFNDTYTGEKILCVGIFLIGVFCFFALPTLIGFLADRLTPLEAKTLSGAKYADYLDYYALGGVILMCLGLISIIIIAPIEFSKNVAKDIKLAKIKQLLPVTKEEWKAIGVKTEKDIFTNLECIFVKSKELGLYEEERHRLPYKIEDDVLDSVFAGYELLWESIENTIKNTKYPLSKELEIVNKRKSIYVTLKTLTTDNFDYWMKEKYLEYIMFNLDSIDVCDKEKEKSINRVIKAAEKEFDELQL